MLFKNTCGKSFLSVLLLSLPFVLISTKAAAANGQPFQQLQDQINAQQDQINAQQEQINQLLLNPSSAPIEVTVNCPGGSINDTLAEYAGIDAPLIVTINGKCDEVVSIQRNNVTLRGATSTDGLALTTTPLGAISATAGLSGITIENMTLDLIGGWGIACVNNTMAINNVVINNAIVGIIAAVGGRCTVNGSTIDGTGTGIGSGVIVGDQAVMAMYSSTIRNTGLGVHVHSNGDAYLGNFTGPGPSVIENTSTGILVTNGSNVSLGSIEIRNNATGVEVFPNSALGINNALSPGAYTSIHNNTTGLVFHQNTSYTHIAGNLVTQVQNNTGYGIVCEPNVTFSAISAGLPVLSGNNGGGAQHDNCPLP